MWTHLKDIPPLWLPEEVADTGLDAASFSFYHDKALHEENRSQNRITGGE